MQKQRHRGLGWLLIITLLILGALVGIGGLIMSVIAVGLLFACGVMGTRQAAHDAGSISRAFWRGIRIAFCGMIQACKGFRKGVKTFRTQVKESGGTLGSDLRNGFNEMRKALRGK